MPIEGLTQSIPNLQELKELFKRRLDNVLNKELTVENIETFGDNALEELVALNEDILSQYNTHPAFQEEAPTSLSIQEQEDDAYEKLGLPNIHDILQKADEIRTHIQVLKEYIINNKQFTDTVITPPQEGSEIIPGNGEGRKIDILPRLITFMYLLEADLSIDREDIKIIEGQVTPHMVRQTPYVRIGISNLDRVVYLCDEKDNASYVFDSEKLGLLGIHIDEIDMDSKREKNNLIVMNAGVGVRITHTKHWRSKMTSALSNPLLNAEIEQRIAGSEFDFIKEFLPFESFQLEVKSTYKGESNVQMWYRKEKKGHPDWPANPRRSYKQNWGGWPELVGIENRTKIKYLEYFDLQAEVRKAYPGKGDVQAWYMEEGKNHKDWPSSPSKNFEGKGWKDWSSLVGRLNQLRKEYLPLEEFQQEVRSLYTGESDIQSWYHKERKNHSHWPSHPTEMYKEDGLKGWPELVGRENRLKQEWLSLEDLIAEARAVYNGETGIGSWYDDERKKHKGWPAQPYFYYGDKWQGYPELVGVENRLKKTFLDFADFQAEVASLYPGEGDVQHWYRTERKKHDNWPAGARDYYLDKGWKGWSELVGIENRMKKEYLKYENFKAEVETTYPGANDIKGWYTNEYKKHKTWPAAPNEKYKGKGWVSWRELVRRM